MLISMNELLNVAQKNSFAVGAFNICDSLLFKTVMEAAEENDAPVIVQLAAPEFAYVGEDFFSFVLKRMEESKVPCVLHLDHGKSMEDCVKAIRCGFNSVMIDGSALSFEENIRITKQVAMIAHCVDVCVEAEIGTIGSLGNSPEDGVENVTYTNPQDAQTFIKETKADTLAVAIGTAHGIYPKGFVPKLRLDILEEIKHNVSVPLVLHGGSSNNDDEITRACQLGIAKVNIASDYRKAFFATVKETLVDKDYFWTPRVYDDAVKEAKKVITHKMHLFGCIGKAKMYR
ncbi:ketose-bisphosphate aldolase [Traorella massiliensis]|uniref:ketose-bisphosphate aldolase n=1 Tax=Traorella massiliensis TaxID=1903263 RepID=UPI0023571B6F|nr:ketose-bisphosphate aldolase [Traorella massiliensis]